MSPVPCIVCKRPLNEIPSGDSNHADDANSFRSRGQYGSTVYDPMDETYLEVNICDQCLTAAAKDGAVLIGEVIETHRRKLKPWSPS